jgi:CubicO group peptidase (beta-lactamase class C family)
MGASTRARLVCSAIALVLTVEVPSAQQQPPLLPPGAALQTLETYLESMRQQTGIPGMSAAMVFEENIIWERGFGYQNVASRIPATPDTPYLIGDMTGTVAAVLLLQCVEQRRLGLDDPFRRYGLSAPDSDATLRRVLSHEAPAGAKDPFEYNPDRYAQLTPLMEWCAPQPYRKSVAHRILNRLAMRDSVPGTDLLDPDLQLPEGLFDPDEIDRYHHVLERLAVPYRVTARNRVERTDVPSMPINAAAGLVSTVRDLAKLDAALDAGILLQDETLDVAWNTTTSSSGVPLPMGLGWFVQSYRGERVVWHFGYVPGAYSSLVLKMPGRHVTFILLANSDGLSAPYQLQQGDVTKSLFAALFLRLFR